MNPLFYRRVSSLHLDVSLENLILIIQLLYSALP